MTQRSAGASRPGRSAITAVVGACALFGALVLAPETAVGQQAHQEFPDGVCFPVNGSGYIVSASSKSRTDRVPIGPFSAVFEGDSLVIEEGTVTFIDFRDRQRSVFGKDTRHRIPHVVDPNAPTRWEEMKQRLTEIFRDRHGYETSASREGALKVWPDDGVEFAPDVPIILTWSADTTASAIQVRTEKGQSEIPISESVATRREIAWTPSEVPSGSVQWSLLDADGEPLLTGRFNVLTAKQADEKREMYRAQAAGDGSMSSELGAVLRALADRSYLW